jgi:hypothetical protein
MVNFATEPPDHVYSGSLDELILSMHALKLYKGNDTLLLSKEICVKILDSVN